MYLRFGKRLFDMVITISGVLFISPVLLFTALLVRIKLGSPVVFKQDRPGRHGQIFTLYKLRTMTNAVDEDGALLSPKERLTPFGRFLRSTSLDELPALWNVIIGDMSLVGPRPLRVEYLPLYSKEQNRRHDVKPGITGWAQVNGRNSISWEEKFSLDVWYVDQQSFFLDLKILYATFFKTLKRDDINQSENQTMESFKGVDLNG